MISSAAGVTLDPKTAAFVVIDMQNDFSAWNDQDFAHTAAAVESHFGVCMDNSQIIGAFQARR